jgi:hypothetical protein
MLHQFRPFAGPTTEPRGPTLKKDLWPCRIVERERSSCQRQTVGRADSRLTEHRDGACWRPMLRRIGNTHERVSPDRLTVRSTQKADETIRHKQCVAGRPANALNASDEVDIAADHREIEPPAGSDIGNRSFEVGHADSNVVPICPSTKVCAHKVPRTSTSVDTRAPNSVAASVPRGTDPEMIKLPSTRH